MRLLLITTILGLAAGNAQASSIDTIASGTTPNNSVATVSCTACPPLQSKKKSTYVVPTIAAGDETIELKKINGEMKVVRTEAWLGGSPVVFVSKPSREVIAQAEPEADPSETVTLATNADVENAVADDPKMLRVDHTSKTAAVTPVGASLSSAPVIEEGSQDFDPSALELRLK
ncbi:plant virulence effector HPE1-like domain-containing protein [Ensifer sp.]|jgi:hypothetical protein|uniref:plant virulence effector HPE1-like domain-containing protein n=1 Tax=Ensifer sp. TaxID=1872086 RepID=UPI002E14DBBD|nr:plant virulence effector HPE1-like domain-containing protein [Ensifer sp.]